MLFSMLGQSNHVRPLLTLSSCFVTQMFYSRKICSVASTPITVVPVQRGTCYLDLNSDMYTAQQIHTYIRFKHILMVSGEDPHGMGGNRLGRKWCLPAVSSSCGSGGPQGSKGKGVSFSLDLLFHSCLLHVRNLPNPSEI